MLSVAVTSGKGGVGKTNVAVNLAVGLARLRHRVALLDADFGLGNVDLLLGLAPQRHLGHVLAGECEIAEVLVDGPEGVRIVPATSGLRELSALTAVQWQRLSAAIDALSQSTDFLIIDTAAGISANVIDMLTTSDRVAVVTSPEPTAIVDAYAMVKVLTALDRAQEVGIVVNGVADAAEADSVFAQLDKAASQFLERSLRYYGFVPHDPAVRTAVLVQRPVIEDSPHAPASRCFRMLASRVAGFSAGGGGLRLMRLRSAPAPASEETEAPQCA